MAMNIGSSRSPERSRNVMPPSAKLDENRPMVNFERDDVLVLGHRPIRSERACPAIVDRRLAPQPTEIGLPHVLLIQSRIADVELIERHGLGERRVIDGLRAPS